jgi:hypothetical protein
VGQGWKHWSITGFDGERKHCGCGLSDGFDSNGRSGSLVDVVMVEQSAEECFASYLFRRGGLVRIFVAERDMVLDALMRAAGVMVVLRRIRTT